MSKINYMGEIVLQCGNNKFITKHANLDITVHPVRHTATNIYKSLVNLLKGYIIEGELTVYGTAFEGFNQWKELVDLLMQVCHDCPITMQINDPDTSVPMKTFIFDSVLSDFDYTSYINNNSKLGFEFNFLLQQSKVVKNLPTFWTNLGYNPRVLSADILIENFICEEN